MLNNILQKIGIVIKHPKPHQKLWGAVKIRINKIRGYIWCAGKSITTKEAIKKVVGNSKYISFYKKFEGEIKKAQKREEQCPVKMGGDGNLEIIYQLSEYFQVRRVIETGVAQGWSSLAFLFSIKNREGSLLISTDIPYSGETAPYVGCVIPEVLQKNWKLIKRPDKYALPEALEILPEIDICHYDSDKTYQGRMFAYPLLWRALREGGLFISDDVADNLAFKNFAEQINVNPVIVKKGKEYVGILIKQ